ncbi:protein FAR1-RELATED SEQUENCE 5-like [Medicago truncatula]|uniref:protein FAR1-RELATED SEQUENCE 5-like n=1 Tax=Medicago truncatula TaxID=3880 RepID=UPI000D2F454E|nr:protein FAR1-RELATED SEQUENCE 5-like [Medicago truncatula]
MNVMNSKRDDLTEMKFLISKLKENGYAYYIREKCESKTVQDLFWTHPTSVKLFNNFPTVLIMDSMYKTNLYMMPLFEIVELTSTYLTYSVGFAFMMSEKEDNFTWALQMLLKLRNRNNDMPKVVVTDRDTTMMNVVENVFPDSSVILCYFHVGKNVREKIITDCKVKQNVVVMDGQHGRMNFWINTTVSKHS